ncbi:TMF family protein [Spirosoma agri]|uniref:TMF family protein n=1 Tax=Spirosoma agri TaxID=1987381 RepID=A0A6M0IIA8_9BACT|nr:TMF family protein [Spirosoma agri]NEU67968.1 TMF family protein [Spirosoma agri]
MKPSILLVLLLLTTQLLAQNNYVATTPNATSPGEYNVLIGPNTANSTMTGGDNVMIGSFVGRRNTTGAGNVFLGNGSGSGNTTGEGNTFVGYSSGALNGTGSSNTFLGISTGVQNRTGRENVFVGANAGQFNTEGNINVFVGNQAGKQNTTGEANVFIGSLAGTNNISGQSNLFLGQQAGGQNTTASYNLFIGNSSGSATTTGIGNTAIGDGSLLRNNSGFHNVAIGRYAGVESRNDENVFIGFSADVTPETPNLRNATAIGARARVSQSNSIVLGANASVGIGTSAPSAKLHLVSGSANTSGLRLENLTSNSPASATSQAKFLTVDGSGNVILGSMNGSAREGAVDALWQRKGSFLQSINGESIIIGQGVDKTSADYNLFVSKGILTEKVKVAVKNTSDWSDYVFDKNYRLKSLAEVGAYIQTNKHLPGVPSAAEVVEKGIDIAKMDAKLLEKIEELTLYSIQLEKESQQQKIVNQHLQQNAKSQQAELDELKQLVKQLLDKR